MKLSSPEEGAASASIGAYLLVFLVVSALVFPIVLGLGMTRGLSHDEQQHVAAGAVVARDGLLPYRDFPYFHTPYLPYAYALLFKASDHLLIAARLVSVLSVTAILGVIGSVAYHLFADRGKRLATFVCAGSVLLALTTTLFTQTAGRAWNHEPSLLLVVLAFVAHLAGLHSGRLGWLAASGALLGLAIGIRLTCAPLIAPFGLALFFYPSPRWHWGRIFSFSGALLLGLAGVFYFFVQVPEEALFANFGFSEANIVYRFDTGEPRTMTLPKKFRYFFKVIMRPDIALFCVGLLPILAAYLANRRTGPRMRFELRFILLLLPFLLIGSLAPSPMFQQYFFPFVPFLLLAGLYAFASIPSQSPWFRPTTLIGCVGVVLSTGMGVRAYHDFGDFFAPSEWEGQKTHRRAVELRSHLHGGRVLTLGPIFPLEAGLSIYPSFVTGPFAWRVSPYIEPEKAARLGIVTPDKLDAALDANPPAGILLGFEDDGEDLLSAYGREHGYELVTLDDEKELWVKRPSVPQ